MEENGRNGGQLLLLVSHSFVNNSFNTGEGGPTYLAVGKGKGDR